MIFPAARDTAGTTPRRLNSRTASLAQRNWPVRLTPITVFHCSRVMSSKGASRCKPALLTRISTVPSLLDGAAEQVLHLDLARDVRADRESAAASLRDVL